MGRGLLVWAKLAISNDAETGEEATLQTFIGIPWNLITSKWSFN